MATTKVSVVQMMDRGMIAAPLAAVKSDTPASVPFVPLEMTAQVMTAAKSVSKAKITGVQGKLYGDLAGQIVVAQNPAQLAAAFIKAKYASLGGAGSFLGAASGAVSPCPDSVGFFQHYAGGSIYWSPQSGVHEVHGQIRQRWSALGWERSFLGYPKSDEQVGRDLKGEGRYSAFTGGTLYYHPATGVFEVHGGILQKYLSLGGDESFLGYPTTDETACPDRIGRFNHFQAGSIYWTPGTGAHEVHGLIRNYWSANGWERNAALGYPVTDELIPNRSIGYTRPSWIRKPIFELPLDVVRLPEEQPSPTLVKVPTATVAGNAVAVSRGMTVLSVQAEPQPVTVPVAKLATTAVTTKLTATQAKAATGTAAIRATATTTVSSTIKLPGTVYIPVAKHTGESQDRYQDFQSGVVFWRRGAAQAELLSPRAQTPDGAKMAWTAAEVVALASPSIRKALTGLPGASILSINYVGTGNYWNDGSGIHNRPHRLSVILFGMKQVIVPIPVQATVEFQVEISLDPVDRQVVGYLTGWNLTASSGDFLGGGNLPTQLRQRIDPVLWDQFAVADIPANPDDLLAVLSVKTQADGSVVVYFEP